MAFIAGALAGALSTHAGAQALEPLPPGPGAWRFSASIYGYLPSVSGSSNFPADSSGNTIGIDASQMLDHLDGAFMGTAEANNGLWGGFTDFIYLKFGRSRSQTRDFTIDRVPISGDTSADLSSELKAYVWTLAGEYRLVSRPGVMVDALAGFRLLDMRQNLSWNISGSLGPLSPAARTGSASNDQRLWDGIVGIKGRAALEPTRKWSVLFYGDVGGGSSDLTWQGAAGVSYAFNWGEVVGMWRYLGYDLKSGKPINDVKFNGPMIGATFRW
jgi:hypothetical protein